jgi:hypothetical protein
MASAPLQVLAVTEEVEGAEAFLLALLSLL